jgi:hypothetical protein
MLAIIHFNLIDSFLRIIHFRIVVYYWNLSSRFHFHSLIYNPRFYNLRLINALIIFKSIDLILIFMPAWFCKSIFWIRALHLLLVMLEYRSLCRVIIFILTIHIHYRVLNFNILFYFINYFYYILLIIFKYFT